MDSESRFIELEIKVAYLEDLVMDLNEVVIRQQSHLERLEGFSQQLLERLKSLQSHGQAENIDQTPPHY